MGNVKESLMKLQKHVMTGISYMGPVFTMAALAKFLSAFLSDRGFAVLSGYIGQMASILYLFIVPVFSAYASYSIADKPGLVPGFVIGWFVSNPILRIPDAGFLGAIVLSILAGYSVKYAAHKIVFKDLYNSVVPTFIIPFITTFLLIPICLGLTYAVFGPLNRLIIDGVNSSGMAGQIAYSVVMAATIAADLGGPINKTAVLFGTLISAEYLIPMTAINLAIVIPPIGVGLSTLADRLFKRHGVYDKDMRDAGKDALKLGFIGLSEGGLPFLYEKPKATLALNIIGSVTGSAVAVALGAKQWFPITAVWGWFLAENVPAYFLGLGVGVIIIAVGSIIMRLKD